MLIFASFAFVGYLLSKVLPAVPVSANPAPFTEADFQKSFAMFQA